MAKLLKRSKPDVKEIRKTIVDDEVHTQDRLDPGRLLPTGSTLLNLALSDTILGGFHAGKVENLVGDSSSGKTFLALTCFAEMCRDPKFKDYRLIFDDVEAALEFNIEGLFGKKLASRIEPPAFDGDGEWLPSDTVESFQDNVRKAIKKGKPFVYILDSLDALTSDAEVEKADDDMKRRDKGQEVKGSYDMNKQKAMSKILRLVARDLRKTASCVIIISQTRANINPMSFETKKRSGGEALTFYCCHVAWLGVVEKIKKKVNGKDRIIGADVAVQVKKNKLTGKVRTINFPIYYDSGVDDYESMIDFLIAEGAADKPKGAKNIKIASLDIDTTYDKIIQKMDDDPYFVEDIRNLVEETWTDIENQLRRKRAKKYE